jgi:hypothetical protein
MTSTAQNFTRDFPFLITYHLNATWTGSAVNGYAHTKWYIVSSPIDDFAYPAGTFLMGALHDITPNRQGTYTFKPMYHDGCGDYTNGTELTFQTHCPAYNFDVIPSQTTFAFDSLGQSCIGLRVDNWFSPAGYAVLGELVYDPSTSNSAAWFGTGWYVTKAPVGSAYEPVNYILTTTTVAVDNFTTITPTAYGYMTNFTNRTTITNNHQHIWRNVSLATIYDGRTEYPLTAPTCFRPDRAGQYEITFRTYLDGSDCNISRSAMITVSCGAPPNLDLVPDHLEVTVEPALAPQVILDASAATDPDSKHLTYYWMLIFPTGGNDTIPNTVHDLYDTNMDSQRRVNATFTPWQAGIDYIFDLIVSDGCTNATKRIYVAAKCSVDISKDNVTLIALYDGSVPLARMPMTYDHHAEIADMLPYPSCQNYWWYFLEYQYEIPEATMELALSGSSTDFVKTRGFGGVIAAIVIVGVTVPVILYLYFTKKACFKTTDPRV